MLRNVMYICSNREMLVSLAYYFLFPFETFVFEHKIGMMRALSEPEITLLLVILPTDAIFVDIVRKPLKWLHLRNKHNPIK
jgi:hypothetical protein